MTRSYYAPTYPSFASTRAPSPAPVGRVPAPMTLLLVGAGLAATAAPHRRRAPSGCTGGVLGSLTALISEVPGCRTLQNRVMPIEEAARKLEVVTDVPNRAIVCFA